MERNAAVAGRETGVLDVLARVPRRRLTTDEYHRMGLAGILGEGDRVELIEGQLIAMSPIGVRHALAVDSLAEQFVLAAAGRVKVRVQNPVALGDGTEPQPDIALVRHRWAGYPLRHPGAGDILLLVEVSDASLPLDAGGKRELYARSGIPEYWVVDLTSNLVRVHRGLTTEGYASVTDVRPPARLVVDALPGTEIETGPLFG